MTFDRAKEVFFRRGRYNRVSLSEIALSTSGLLYLHDVRKKKWVKGDLREALEIYLVDPTVSERLSRAIKRREDLKKLGYDVFGMTD